MSGVQLETTARERAAMVRAIEKTYGTVSAHPFNQSPGKQWAIDQVRLCRDIDKLQAHETALVRALGQRSLAWHRSQRHMPKGTLTTPDGSWEQCEAWSCKADRELIAQALKEE